SAFTCVVLYFFMTSMRGCFFVFLQAEDGIRDPLVTGVQTCALPILLHDAINLAQGFPDFAAPEEIKRAAQQAIAADINQYAITWGAQNLRDAVARNMKASQGLEFDPESEITVCCGSTEAMIASLLAVTDPGDEIIIFEPFYENYGPHAILSGARPRFVKLRPPERTNGEWTFDERELCRACGRRPRASLRHAP